MGSYFTITLDTTGPSIEVFIPEYALSSREFHITIEPNEEVDPSFQEFTLTDSLGEEHVFTLPYIEGVFTGSLSLENIPLGISTITARVRDTVLNLSPIVSKTFQIVNGSRVRVVTNLKTRKIISSVKTRSIKTSYKRRTVKVVVK